MSTPTFSPFRGPDSGTNDVPEFKIRSADFGDGYTQASPDGLNSVRRVMTVTWSGLTPDQVATFAAFFMPLAGASPFWWTPSDEGARLLWTCKDYDDTRELGGLRTLKLVFRQSFNPTT